MSSTEPADAHTVRAYLTELLDEDPIARDRVSHGMAAIVAAARSGRAFTTSRLEVPTFRLTEDAHLPDLVCVGGILPIAVHIAYARLAGALRGSHRVLAVGLPGFRAGENLPADTTALARAMAIAVEKCCDDEPLALLGFSSGGWVAHALTAGLSSIGVRVRALILLDTPPQGVVASMALSPVLRGMLAAGPEFVATDDSALTAMGWYFELFQHRWSPGALSVPVRYIRAGSDLPGNPNRRWSEHWTSRATAVPGDHLTILTEHVDTTAGEIRELLTEFPASS
ncbi:alpha/beta fold hydrolase [Nocardia panacis]|nr:alpha/beta fold hydrolase [Nocardia panacis]